MKTLNMSNVKIESKSYKGNGTITVTDIESPEENTYQITWNMTGDSFSECDTADEAKELYDDYIAEKTLECIIAFSESDITLDDEIIKAVMSKLDSAISSQFNIQPWTQEYFDYIKENA